MRHTLANVIKDLSLKYQLTDDDMKEIIEKTLIDVLRRTSKSYSDFDVHLEPKEGRLKIWAYKDMRHDLYVRAIDATNSLSVNTLRLLKSRLVKETHKFLAKIRYTEARQKVGTVINGCVRKQQEGKLIVVEVGTGDVGECSIRHQPVRERGQYQIGEIYQFYVLKAEAYEISGIYSIVLGLSRTTWKLPVVLLRKAVEETGLDVTIKPLKRIPGRYTKCLADQKVPREAILSVSKELNERIIIEFPKNP